MAALFIRIGLDETRAIGPGKIRLLELIHDTGSISAAARALEMSYRRAWLLVDEVNRAFENPAVISHPGGKAGGGAQITPWGHELIAHYRRIESRAGAAVAEDIASLRHSLRG
jgi:molybdate transport system regulatory protein